MVDREAAARAIDAFLRALGRDPSREPELSGTGERVANAYADDLCRGYDVDGLALLRSQAIAAPAGTTAAVADQAPAPRKNPQRCCMSELEQVCSC